MLITKGLLVKGIAASAALTTASLGAVYNKYIFDSIFGDKTIERLGIPSKCKVDGEECEISDSELKKIEFKDKDGNVTLEGNVSGLKLSIKKLQESDKARYGEGIKAGDLWFTFKTDNITQDIKVKKGETVITSLIKGTNPEFKINNGKLEKAWTVTELAKKVNLKCPADNSGSENKCSVEAGKQISYKNSNNVQQLTTSSQVTDGITYTKDTQEYNQGFKFTVSSAVSGSNSSSLPAGEYEIKYEEEENKGWYLFKKGEIAQAGGGSQGTNSANTEINNKITGTLKLPEDCKFTDSDTTNPKECSLDETKLKAIEFKDKDGDLTIEGSVSGLKLSIKKLQDSDKQQYGEGINANDLWFTFKDFSNDIKVKKSDGTAIVSLIKGTNPEFKINNDKLEKAWSADSLAKKVGLKCCDPNSKKCTINTTGLKFSDDGTSTKNLTLTTEDADKITYTEDQQDHNQGFKFNVSSEVTGTGGAAGSSSEQLAANSNYEVKYEEGENKGWYLSKKTNSTT